MRELAVAVLATSIFSTATCTAYSSTMADTTIVDYRSVNVQWLSTFKSKVISKELQPSVELVVALKDYRAHKKSGFKFQQGETLKVEERKGKSVIISRAYGDVREGKVSASYVEEKPREEWTTEEVCEYIIKPPCMESECTYLEVMPESAVSPQEYFGTFVSQARKCCFGELVEALEYFFGRSDKDLSEQFVWLDVFCANQPKLTAQTVAKKTGKESAKVLAEKKENEKHLTRGLHTAIANFEQRVMFMDKWDAPTTLTRAWCVWELFGVAKAGKQIEIALTPGERDRYLKFLMTNYFAVISKLVKLDASTATCFSEADLTMIRSAILEESSYEEVNDLVSSQLRLWVANTAAEELENAEMAEDKDLHKIGLLASCTGLTYQDQGQLERAEPFLRKAVKVSKEKYGDRNKEVGTSLGNLGLLLNKMGRNEEAAGLLEEALEVQKAISGPDDEKVALALNNLGLVRSHLNQLEEAIELYAESMRIYQKLYGREHEGVATVLNNLAGIYGRLGNVEKQEEMEREVLSILGKTLGNDHPHYATTLNTLAGLFMMQRRYKEAEEMLRGAIKIWRKIYGNENVIIMQACHTLAIALRSQVSSVM